MATVGPVFPTTMPAAGLTAGAKTAYKGGPTANAGFASRPPFGMARTRFSKNACSALVATRAITART